MISAVRTAAQRLPQRPIHTTVSTRSLSAAAWQRPIQSRRHSSEHQHCHKFSSSAITSNGLIHNQEQVEYYPEGITRQPDFFGEDLTFINDLDPSHIQPTNESKPAILTTKSSASKPSLYHDVTEVMSSFDNMCLCIITKGSANIHNGNDGEGPEVRSWHASAIAWADLLTHASEWNCGAHKDGSIASAPMLAVAAVAPVLAQGGIHYLHRIDGLLSSSSSLVNMARYAASFRDVFVSSQESSGVIASENDNTTAESLTPILSPRERWHLHALHQLLQNNHREAMGAYLRLLELYPGDLLGLSLALDVAYTLGDADLALRAATNVSTYWTERDGGRLNHSHPGQTMATSLIAVGLASSSSSKASTSERLAETALARDSDSAGGTAVWALSQSLAAEGRSQEMVSRLATSDGVQLYEASGYLSFNTRMSGYGVISILDTERSGANRSALRMYDGSFGHVLEYSGNNVECAERGGEKVYLGELKVPRNVKDDMRGAVGSLFSGWFGGGGGGGSNNSNTSSEEGEPKPQDAHSSSTQGTQPRSTEAVLTWLPPSPILITQATALLLRLTLCDAISTSDHRWADIKTAWEVTLQNDNFLDLDEQTSVEFMPMALLTGSLLIEPAKLHSNPIPLHLEMAMEGLNQMGKLMKLGQLKIQTTSSTAMSTISTNEEWRAALTCLSHARDSCRWEMPSGIASATYLPSNRSHQSASLRHIGWDFDTRQIIEHSLCHSAMQVGDYESLCLAKAVCSEGTMLRSNCPEVWSRYANVMQKLGDDVVAENARAASVSLGGGEGSPSF